MERQVNCCYTDEDEQVSNLHEFGGKIVNQHANKYLYSGEIIKLLSSFVPIVFHTNINPTYNGEIICSHYLYGKLK